MCGRCWGALALATPGLPRLKEWAYAGAVFDFSGAVVSHLAVGDSMGKAIAPLVFAVLTMASWALRTVTMEEEKCSA